MSSVSSRSPSPLPDRISTVQSAKHKKKKEKKKKTQPEVEYTVQGKNEGTSSYWAYQPPEDAVLMDHEVDCGELDWDAVRDNENLELWVVRVPEKVRAAVCLMSNKRRPHEPVIYGMQVKPAHLDSLQLDEPSSSRAGIIGSLKRKNNTYNVWSLGQESDDNLGVGGEEIKSLSCLLPRKKKDGKLFLGTHSFLSSSCIRYDTNGPS
jgi:hypothetical protein